MIWTALRWIAASRVGQAVAGVLALLGVVAYRERKARQEGAQQATEAARGKDRDRAREIEDAADAARAVGGDDPVDRLRKSGLIRDD